VQKARDPVHAAEVLSYAVGRVALFEEPGTEVLNDRAEKQATRNTGGELSDTAEAASDLQM
jgi:hypothetical protein